MHEPTHLDKLFNGQYWSRVNNRTENSNTPDWPTNESDAPTDTRGYEPDLSDHNTQYFPAVPPSTEEKLPYLVRPRPIPEPNETDTFPEATTEVALFTALAEHFTDHPRFARPGPARRGARFLLNIAALQGARNKLSASEKAYLQAAEERRQLQQDAKTTARLWAIQNLKPPARYENQATYQAAVTAEQRKLMRQPRFATMHRYLVEKQTGEWLGRQAEAMLARSFQPRPYLQASTEILHIWGEGLVGFFGEPAARELGRKFRIPPYNAHAVIKTMVEDGTLQTLSSGVYYFAERTIEL